ncbi:MAG: SlyX family protein [Proteobacteria bacterium]|nr:SlyX family protein [Pseudomonadota bacterium]
MDSKPDNSALDSRVMELEVRLTHLEDTIEVLNKTIIAQYGAIDLLELQVSQLEKKIKASQSSPVAHESEETPPPHY